MTAHLIIERTHHGPRLVQTFESREAAEESRQELIAEEPDLERALYIVVNHATRLPHSEPHSG